MCFQQSEVEPYLDKNIWNTLASNIPVDSMGYSKDMLPDSRDIINFVEGSQSILIDTREGMAINSSYSLALLPMLR